MINRLFSSLNELPATHGCLQIGPEWPVEAGAHFSSLFIRDREEEQWHFCFCCYDLQVFRGIHEPSLPDLKCTLIRTIFCVTE